MTLDEAIKHAEEVANANERLCETVHPAMQLSDYSKCAEEHRQLVEWLKDYKRLKEQEPCEDAINKTEVIKAIDEREDANGKVDAESIRTDIVLMPPVKTQEPCEMTAEEYRQRMIQAFHNANTDELIAVCVLPTEKEFEHLEWLLKNHYKKASCADVISRQAVIDGINRYFHDKYYQRTSIQDCRDCLIEDVIKKLPPVNTRAKEMM